jgi:hypothetical protein
MLETCFPAAFVYSGRSIMQEMNGDLFSEIFDDDIAVITLLEFKNILKLRSCISLMRVRDSVMSVLYIRCCAVCTSDLASYRYEVLISSLPALLLCRIRIRPLLALYGRFYPTDASICYGVIPPLLHILCRLNLTRAAGLVMSALHPTVASVCLCRSRIRTSHGRCLSIYFSRATAPRV